MKKIEKSIELGGRTLTLQTGKLAGQATGAVFATYGDTVVLATVVASDMTEDKGFFPLSVEYQERLYAGGRIKGSRWVKREGRPTDEEILTGRLIDRSIRPLFYKDYVGKEVQVIIMVLSVDLENDPAHLAPIAVAAAIEASRIPWQGPVGVVSVGLYEGDYILNPRETEKTGSEMDLVVACTKDAVVMIEAGANEVEEEKLLGGIAFAQKEAQKVIAFISEFAKEVGVEKEKVEKKVFNQELLGQVKKLVEDKLPGLVKNMAIKEGYAEYDELARALTESVGAESAKEALGILDKLYKETVRKMILSGSRPDGRKHKEIRKLSSEVGVLPRTHGSAVFTRGETQALSVATLGSSSLGQLVESAEGESEKRYMHHYSMPPYSVGEVGKVGSPSRREIGHGALAERALSPVIPEKAKFPYAIRVVSEVLSSNGSTSMASTCGSTLSLMDAGVPIKAPVSGIAMGLVIESEKEFAVLSDIAGIEDFNGDMDFKVAGTSKGITALQLDVKTLELSLPILETAMKQAKEGRAFILESMLATISAPREKVATYAPKIRTIVINKEKIGEVIGPGGKTIRKIIAESGAEVDVEDDGTVSISALSTEAVEKAIGIVEGLTKEVQPGEIYRGVVKRIESFGAFVEILPGKDGLVRVSNMAQEFVKEPSDKVSIDQEVEVRVIEVDDMGRINLSMILDPALAKDSKRPERRDNRDGGERRSYRPRREMGRDTRGGDRSSGPHFPASRLLNNQGKKRY